MEKEIKYTEIKDGNFSVEFSTAFYKDFVTVYKQILEKNKPEELLKCFYKIKTLNSNESQELNDLENVIFIFVTLLNASNKEIKNKGLFIEKSKTVNYSEKEQEKLSEFQKDAEKFIKDNPDFIKLFENS